MSKLRSKGFINPDAGQRATRNIGRIKTLRKVIANQDERGNAEKLAAYRAELDRRLSEVAVLKAQLDAATNDTES